MYFVLELLGWQQANIKISESLHQTAIV